MFSLSALTFPPWREQGGCIRDGVRSNQAIEENAMQFNFLITDFPAGGFL